MHQCLQQLLKEDRDMHNWTKEYQQAKVYHMQKTQPKRKQATHMTPMPPNPPSHQASQLRQQCKL